MKDISALARDIMQVRVEDLTDRERGVLERFIQRRRVAQNINRSVDDQSTFGERLSDRVAQFGGSWKFIIIFAVVLVSWTAGNAAMSAFQQKTFDPYPFIFLNLILSMLAAVQAPIIMMSQNRQADKDRIAAGHDYEVNLKAELEIMQLHEKLDEMRQSQLTSLLEQQARQIELVEKLLGRAE